MLCARLPEPNLGKVLVNDIPGSAAFLLPLQADEITPNLLINDLFMTKTAALSSSRRLETSHLPLKKKTTT